jgi:predicted porin
MIRKTISALAAFMLATGAMAVRAEATVFGHGDAGQPASNPADPVADTPSECAQCQFGLDGHNELGNGLRAIYRMDWNYDGAKRESQDRWLGIGGDFGEVKLGTLSTAYKAAGVLPDAAYRPSTMNAFGAPSTPGGEQTGTRTGTDGNGGVGLSYENAGLLIFADHISNNAGSDDTAYDVGAKLATDNFAVFGRYRIDTGTTGRELTTTGPGLAGTSPEDSNLWFLGGSLTVGDTSIYAGYGRGDNSVNAGALPGYDAWEVVGVHSLGKLTSIYAGYSGTGCVDKNTATCSKPGTDTVDEDKFSLGIKHNF